MNQPAATDGGVRIPSDCRKCMNNLLSTLNSIQSKPMTLFLSMGVDISSYEQNSSGILVRIPKAPSITDNRLQWSAGNQEGFGGAPIASNTAHVTFEASNTNHNTKSGSLGGVLGRLKRTMTKSINIPISTSQAAPVATSAITKPGIELQIMCKKCGNDGPEAGARAYVKGPQPLSIVLCSNRLNRKEDIEEVLVHELIHVYDVHYRNWDLTNCYTLAKSEVRAAREAECGDASISFTKRYCAKEKARVATKNMFPDLGTKCVAAIFEEAMADKAPFFDNNVKNRTDDNTVNGRSFQSTYKGDS